MSKQGDFTERRCGMNNDLISRSALKEAFADMREGYPIFSDNEMLSTKDIAKIIDNVPAVDIEKLGESLNCQIRATYGSCDDCLLSCPRNELIKLLDSARPLGEWIKGEEISRTMLGDKVEHIDYRDYTCSNCGLVLDNLLYNYDGSPFYKFCPNCGARMKGGAEE